MASLLEIELACIFNFVGRIPEIKEQMSHNIFRFLVFHNFFPMLAVKQSFRWAELKYPLF